MFFFILHLCMTVPAMVSGNSSSLGKSTSTVNTREATTTIQMGWVRMGSDR